MPTMTIIITPKRLELDEARRQIQKILKESGLMIELTQKNRIL